MAKAALILLLILMQSGHAAASGSLHWSADAFTFDGHSVSMAHASPGYVILDACAWGDTVILALGRPGQARGEIVRAFRFGAGGARVAWTSWMQRQRPWRVRVADVDADGAPELAVGVFNKARFHPVDADRVFIYNLLPGGLSPKWLGTRLSQPLAAFEFADAAPDLPGDELVAVERNVDGSHRAAVYAWNGFGFTLRSVPLAFFSFESMRIENDAVFINNHPAVFAPEAP